MESEIIIVGAGPAGATAAMELAQLDHDVLLIDRASFPRDKVCGDGILRQAVETLDDLGAGDLVRKAGFHAINKSRYVSYGGATLDFSSADLGYTAPRKEFDDLLVQHAVASGAKLVTGAVTGPLLQNGRVAGVRLRADGTEQTLRSRLVIGAGGSTCPIARALRTHRPHPKARLVAIRAYIEEFDCIPHCSEFFALGPPMGGYAWIFPLGDTSANVGLGLRMAELKRYGYNLKEMLAQFLTRPDLKARRADCARLHDSRIWTLDTAGQTGVQRTADGAMLIGDAACLIDPFDGGGILNGFMSARLAANVGHRALRRGSTRREDLRDYEAACERVILKRMRRRHRQARLLTAFPFILEWIIRYARTHNQYVHKYVAINYAVTDLLRRELDALRNDPPC